MSDPTLRTLMGQGGPKFGHLVVEFATPGIGHVLSAAGADFMFFDMEHSGFSTETVKAVVRYAQAARLPTFVRVPGRDYPLMARVADVGAEGIMVPMIGSAEDAAECARHIRYTPRGHRGVGLALAHDDYREGPVLAKLAALNSRMLFLTLIETASGVENVEAIAALEGVDVLWLGHFDLSCSMGIPGQFDHPHFHAAIDRVIAAARRNGKGIGRLVGSVEEGAREARRGFDWICYGGDVWLLQGALRDGIAGIKAKLGQG
jgi:2-dehydro-3-deoxyglucarate aldolase/4-hydroxy-2-oxoheptanedioate aldolase